MRPTTEVLDPEIARRLFYEDGDPVKAKLLPIPESAADLIPPPAGIECPWHIRIGDVWYPIDPSNYNAEAIIYFVTGSAFYVGVTTRLADANAYWTSGINSRPFFSDPANRAAAERKILEFVPKGGDYFAREYHWQNMFRDRIINENYEDGNGLFLNLRIGMPGMDGYWQHPKSNEKMRITGTATGKSGRGGFSPIVIRMKSGEYRYYPSAKSASAFLGIASNGSTLREYLTDKNWNVVAYDYPLHLRHANPTKRYEKLGVEWVWYDY